MCIIHLLWRMLIEIALTRSVGGLHPHSLFMNNHITFAFTHQACRQPASQAPVPLFYVMLNLHIIPVFTFCENSLTQPFTQNTVQLLPLLEHGKGNGIGIGCSWGSVNKKNQWLLHIYCVYLVEVLFVRFDPFSMSLDVCVCVCSLGCFLLFNIAYTQSLHTYVGDRVCVCAGCYTSTKIKCFIKSCTMFNDVRTNDNCWLFSDFEDSRREEDEGNERV